MLRRADATAKLDNTSAGREALLPVPMEIIVLVLGKLGVDSAPGIDGKQFQMELFMWRLLGGSWDGEFGPLPKVLPTLFALKRCNVASCWVAKPQPSRARCKAPRNLARVPCRPSAPASLLMVPSEVDAAVWCLKRVEPATPHCRRTSPQSHGDWAELLLVDMCVSLPKGK